MTLRRVALVAMLSGFALCADGGDVPTGDAIDEAAGIVGYSSADFRKPSELPELPPAFAARLTLMRCRIPERLGFGGVLVPEIITGEFAAPGQRDWAVICVRGPRSNVIVYWGGNAHCADLVTDWASNCDFLEMSSSTEAQFVRSLELNARDDPESRYLAKAVAGGLLEHDGFVDWHDTVRTLEYHYCHRGEWHNKLEVGE